MAVIIITRGAHHKGEEVAEKAAQRLGSPCVSREVLIEASKQYNVPEVKLKKSMERAPNFFERLGFEKDKYITYIQSALLKRLREDNIVYHGLAGHFSVQNVSHVILTRIIVDIKDRVRYCMQSEQVSEARAYEMLQKLDQERKKWGQYLYGIDTTDPKLYDMILNINKLSTDDAADIICSAAALDKFKTTPESRQAMEDLALAAEVKAVLMNEKPAKEVTARDGNLSVKVQGGMFEDAELAAMVTETVKTVDGVKTVEVDVLPYIQPV